MLLDRRGVGSDLEDGLVATRRDDDACFGLHWERKRRGSALRSPGRRSETGRHAQRRRRDPVDSWIVRRSISGTMRFVHMFFRGFPPVRADSSSSAGSPCECGIPRDGWNAPLPKSVRSGSVLSPASRHGVPRRTAVSANRALSSTGANLATPLPRRPAAVCPRERARRAGRQIDHGASAGVVARWHVWTSWMDSAADTSMSRVAAVRRRRTTRRVTPRFRDRENATSAPGLPRCIHYAIILMSIRRPVPTPWPTLRSAT